MDIAKELAWLQWKSDEAKRIARELEEANQREDWLAEEDWGEGDWAHVNTTWVMVEGAEWGDAPPWLR